jgi:hypothetical protein
MPMSRKIGETRGTPAIIGLRKLRGYSFERSMLITSSDVITPVSLFC